MIHPISPLVTRTGNLSNTLHFLLYGLIVLCCLSFFFSYVLHVQHSFVSYDSATSEFCKVLHSQSNKDKVCIYWELGASSVPQPLGPPGH